MEQHLARHEAAEAASLLEAVFESIPDGTIVFDLKGKILRMNPAALTLFEELATSEDLFRGTSYSQFMRRYKIYDENQQPISLKHWPISRIIYGDMASGPQEDPIMIRLPSGRNVYVTVSCAPVLDSQHRQIGTVCAFRNITEHHWNEHQLQQINRALLSLLQTIASIPTLVDGWSPESALSLPPVMSFVGRHLADLISHLLKCNLVLLLSLGPPADHLYSIAMGGLAPEQEQHYREMSGRFSLSDIFDQVTLAHLYANKEISITPDRIRIPFLDQSTLNSRNITLTPIFLDKQLAGVIVIARATPTTGCTSEEIALVRAVAILTALVIECARSLHALQGENAREFILQQTHQFINEFLNLTSHELRTPLAATMGNIQLAQRRLETLKANVTDLPETVNRAVEQIRQPLENASQSARLQERIIRDMIDDTRIQTHTLTLHLQRYDLIKLVREVVAQRQQQVPERKIILDIQYGEGIVPVIADADRIKQVVDIYLTNALNYSPDNQPVTIEVTAEGSVARVQVHDEGPGIPPEEQKRVWERFYRAKGLAVQHELDLSLGLSLYICRELIKYHHGDVGLQSVLDHGSTFWFTLPVASQQKHNTKEFHSYE